MSRPISPELVLSQDFWNLNIPRYFSFALHNMYAIIHQKNITNNFGRIISVGINMYANVEYIK